MKIDAYCHILPPRYADALFNKVPSGSYIHHRLRGVRGLVDLDLRFRIMDAFGDYAQILSLPLPPVEIFADSVDTAELARIANDEMAELVAKYPTRFLGAVACLPLNDVEASLREADRAIKQLGLRGVQVYSNIRGRPLDSPEFAPLFARMAEHDLPLWIHPHRGAGVSDYAAEEKSKLEIWHVFGWPYETTAAMTRIVFSGLFDTHPNLKIITHHLGAMVPFFEARIRGAYDQFGTRTADEDYAGLARRLQKHPHDYFRMFYADTALYGGPPALECGLAFFGADHVVFASDLPFDPEGGAKYVRLTLQALGAMRASAKDKQKIYEGNIRRLLHLPAGAASPPAPARAGGGTIRVGREARRRAAGGRKGRPKRAARRAR
jgi:predicted TIM-barrel fold metal-dependent hydrolase